MKRRLFWVTVLGFVLSGCFLSRVPEAKSAWGYGPLDFETKRLLHEAAVRPLVE